MPTFYDVSLPAGLEQDQRAKMAALIEAAVRPTAAEVSLMCRSWMDLVEDRAATATGVTGCKFYIPRATFEVEDPTGVDVEAAIATAVSTAAAIEPDATDLHTVAVMVLGETLATQLGL